MNALFVMD